MPTDWYIYVEVTARQCYRADILGWDEPNAVGLRVEGRKCTIDHSQPDSGTTMMFGIYPDHKLTKTDEAAPTCTEDGTEAYWTCEDCGKMFSDEGGTQEITAPQKIDSLGHDWEEVEYEWSENNLSVTASRVCTRNDTHVDSETAEASSKVTQPATCTDRGKTKYTAEFKNEAFSSAEKEVAAREATCTEDGNVAYWVCDQGGNPCGKYFSDAEGSSEINKADITVAAVGHDWGEWTVTKKATETEEGIETRTCRNDASHQETRAIQKLEPKEITYSCTEGSGTKWTKGSKKGVSFTFNRSENDSEAFDHFTGIQVDGKDVDPSDYTAEAGSVIVNLKASCLKTLSAGKHTLTARFDDGDDVTVEFTVLNAKAGSKNSKSTDNKPKSAAASPETGDDSNMVLWVCLLLGSLAAMGGIMITRRKGNR